MISVRLERVSVSLVSPQSLFRPHQPQLLISIFANSSLSNILEHAWDERLITDSLKSFKSFLAVNLRRHSRGSNKILHQSEHGIDRSNNMWSQPLSALRCRMSSWALRRKSSVQSEYINCSTIANILNSPIGGQARFQLISCIKVFVRATSTTFMRTIGSFPSQMLLISDSSFYTMIRQTYKYVVQIKRRDFLPFLV